MSGYLKITENTYRKQFRFNQPNFLDSTINIAKHVFRYTVSKLETAIRYILSVISDYSNQNSTLAERKISVRVNNIKDMKDSAWLMLGSNKDIRLHHANSKQILEIYPQANIIAPNPEIQSINNKELISKKEGKELIYNMVELMFTDIIELAKNNPNNSKKMLVALKLPSFNNIYRELSNTECLETYYHACNQWMINIQLYFNTRIILLPCIDSKIEQQKLTTVSFTQHSEAAPRVEILNFKQDQNLAYRDINDANKNLASLSMSKITAENLQYYSNIADRVADGLYLEYTIRKKLDIKNQQFPTIETAIAENKTPK
jgi:hypothetical protein